MSTASLRLVIRCVVAIVLFAAPVAAQSITGTIQGTVVDNQNLAVPAATVTVRNIDTNLTRVAVTDAEGLYRFLNMPVGNYELRVELCIVSRNQASCSGPITAWLAPLLASKPGFAYRSNESFTVE